MNKKSARVCIASTQGVIDILSVSALPDPDLHSVVTINHTSKKAKISHAYGDFVEAPQGIIHQDFKGHGYRLNLSSDIDYGESWQLGVYLAHFLHHRDQLVSNKTADIVIIATGKVDTVHRQILAIDELDTKCLRAREDIKQWQAQGKNILFLVPKENLRVPACDAAVPLTPVSSLDDLQVLLNLYLSDETSGNAPRQETPTDLVHDLALHPQDIEDAVIIEHEDKKGDDHKQIHSEGFYTSEHSVPRGAFIRNKKFAALGFLFLSCVLTWWLLVAVDKSSDEPFDTHFLLVANHQPQGSCDSPIVSVISSGDLANNQLMTPNRFARLCDIKLVTSDHIKSLWLVSESKAIVPLQVLPKHSIDSLKQIVTNHGSRNHAFFASNNVSDMTLELVDSDEAKIWQIPAPENQALNRQYHLLAFDDVTDEADFQSLEAFLLVLYDNGEAHSAQDLRLWHDKAKLNEARKMFIIGHELIFE